MGANHTPPPPLRVCRPGGGGGGGGAEGCGDAQDHLLSTVSNVSHLSKDTVNSLASGSSLRYNMQVGLAMK